MKRESARIQRERQGIKTVQLSSQRASFQKKVLVLFGMPVITGIHLSVPFINKGNCKLGSTSAFKAGGRTKETK